MDTRHLPDRLDVLAPDGSEIRLLVRTTRGSMVHCTLPPGKATLAVRHRTVEEVWYGLEGEGEVWRKQGEDEQVVALRPGVSLSIPVGVHFQFLATGTTPLKFLIVTMPPWPGEQEAERVEDYWKTP